MENFIMSDIYSVEDHFQELMKSPKKPTYSGTQIHSTYIEMPDGVKIAANVALPIEVKPDVKLSTALIQTRYWRSSELRFPFKYFLKSLSYTDINRILTRFGFALVYLDVRGTGASLGSSKYAWNEQEVKDMKSIIDWIVVQPWSDGKIIPLGISYSGTTAELALSINHPAVKGAIAMFNELDPFLDIAFPGGVYNEGFIEMWARSNESLDANSSKNLGTIPRLLFKGVSPVESDKSKTLLKEAVKQHASNGNVAISSRNVNFRDDIFNQEVGTAKSFSVYRYQQSIEKSHLPLYYWGSWMDAATSNVVLATFLTFKSPVIGVIGAWTHGASARATPHALSKEEIKLDPKVHHQAWIHFIDSCINDSAPSQSILYYYTMVEEKWKRTVTWPPKGMIMKKWYFREGNELSMERPTDEQGEDTYKINYDASTGKNNRWYTQKGGGPVIYKDRNTEDEKLLTYTSSPLAEDLEITGHPIINLFLTSTHEDGAIFAYLEEVDQNGISYLITEGQFRVIHRKLSSEPPLYILPIPHHTYTKKDALPLIPGELAEIQFALIPTSIVIPKGHRFRISLGGADKDTFTKLPKQGFPTIQIFRNESHASCIEIPIIEKP